MRKVLHCNQCDVALTIPMTVSRIKLWSDLNFDKSVVDGDPDGAVAFIIEVERITSHGYIYAPAYRAKQQYFLHPNAVKNFVELGGSWREIQLDQYYAGGAEALCRCGSSLGFFADRGEGIEEFISDDEMTIWKTP